ncbi:hypothetical protein Dda_7676 [Drechslerella dactyloides]|uniref:DNA replication checkpoint mediator MRC1 domain-containing protein n=1 Tax=Drechslerella dactyloides TaxID=74499 RepID=A0AAD6NH19_DREDA|nr:hypothetical protein Dda_7676 [Drechslerella dactyloides]
MSSPESPSSGAYASPSPPGSPKIDLTMTPKSKIAALLAQFSDSDSDGPASKPRAKSPSKQHNSPPRKAAAVADDNEEDDDDDMPVARHRARATKMASIDSGDDIEMADADTPSLPKMSAAERLRQGLFGNKSKEVEPNSNNDTDSDDAPKQPRRRMLKKKSSPIQSAGSSPARSAAKSASPRPITSNSTGEDTTAQPKRQNKTKKGEKPAGKKSSKSKKSKKPSMQENASGSDGNSQISDSDDDSLSGVDSDVSVGALIEESKLVQLVNKRRQANKEKEAIEEAKRRARQEASQPADNEEPIIFDDISEGEPGKRPTKTKQPSVRKASKKAVFEMQAETQRMARNMNLQLTAPPRKKFPVADLWAKLGLKDPNAPRSEQAEKSQPDALSSSIPNTSEVEQSSPPSSFTTSPKKATVVPERTVAETTVEKMDSIITEGDDLPSLEQLMQESYAPKDTAPLDKGKGTVVDQDIEMFDVPGDRKLGFQSIPKLDASKSTKAFPTIVPKLSVQANDDSDSDDLEIIPPPAITIAKPVPKSDPLKDLRRLSKLNSPESKRKGRFGKNAAVPTDWLADLQRKAREQIKADEQERVNELRAQGIEVLTEADKEKEMFGEDHIEKARQEARELKDRERREEARRRGVHLADLTDDSENDGDWQEDEGDDDDLSGSDSEGSGSGEEDVESEAEGEEQKAGSPTPGQREATPVRLSDMPKMMESDDEDAVERAPTAAPRRQRARAVVKDDEDEDEKEEQPEALDSITHVPSSMQSPQKPAPFAGMQASLPLGLTQMFDSSMEAESVPSSLANPKEDAPGVFAGINPQGPVMGLTQMFESSMDSQTSDSGAQNRMDMLRQDVPDDLGISQIPLEPLKGNTQMQAQTQSSMLDLAYSQSQVQYEPESMLQPMDISTQMSDYPDPTPDMGFQYNPDQAPPRFMQASQAMDSESVSGKRRVPSGLTESTVIVSPETTPKPKKGRLIRRNRVGSEDEASEKAGSDSEAALSASEKTAPNAFDLLGKKAKKAAEVYDKKKSRAKDMFQEAAEESEDEYAGLGGASDEDSNDEDLSELEDLIDNETMDADDGAHAELDLKRNVADDEKDVQKLMKDITHGNLRKRRGAGFDLDDSDEEEYRRERRRLKNAAERRRLLMQHDNISKIADNPKRQAFLSIIAGGREGDRSFLDEEEDYDFGIHADTQNTDSQSADKTAADNQADSPSAAEPAAETQNESNEKEPSGNPRRTNKKRKPKTLLEVQRSVSSLLDDGTDKAALDDLSSSDIEIEELDTITKRRKVAVVDRVAMKRSATTTSESTKLAYYRGSNSTDPTGQFKIPALVRRATTQAISETTTVAPKAAIAETTTSMKRVKAVGASINFQYREAAKQKNIEKAVNGKKKEEKKVMGARRANAANVFNAGGFS